MKTLQQAAKEYVKELAQFSAEDESTLRMAESIFLAGAAFTTRWISVVEELPEDSNDVLVLFSNGRKGIGAHMSHNEWGALIAREFDTPDLKVLAWRPIEHKE